MKKIIPAVLLTVAASVGISSCNSLTSAGLNPFESTIPVPATVVSAGSVKYNEGLNLNKKSKKWSAVQESTAGYSQAIKIRTTDGREYSYSHSVSSDSDGLSVGDTGTAKVGVTSGKVWGFTPGS